jgi:tetratricopeptide (TPR) repeat protein
VTRSQLGCSGLIRYPTAGDGKERRRRSHRQDKVKDTPPRPAAVSAALALLIDANAAMNHGRGGLSAAPLSIEEIMASAREIYASACTPANTALIIQLMRNVLRDPIHQKDPEIWALYANVQCCDYLNQWNSADFAELAAAEHAAETALRLEPNHRRAVYVSAFLHRARGRHSESLAAFERVIALKPEASDRMIAEAYAQSGAQWMYLGQPERTRELVDKAIVITPPDSPAIGVFYWITGRLSFVQGNYGDAIDWLKRSIMIRTNFWYTRAWLIAAYALNNQIHAAQQALIEFKRLFPQLNSVAAVVGAEVSSMFSHPLLIDARQRMLEGLALAGLPPEETS